MISDSTLSAVRDRTNIAAIIGETVRLQRRGRSLLGLCPFHQEKSPSFSVSAERGYYYCFGCKEHGSAIDFVMKLEGKSFPEAVRALAERAGIEIEETATEAERREEQAARRAKEDLFAVNALAATFFEHSLRGGPGQSAHPLAPLARVELARRELTPDAPAALAFRIGYAPYAWDGLTSYFQKQGISPAVAERVGLLVPRASGPGHYDRFRHRLMFPVLDVSGRVIAFSGRALPEPSEEELRAIGMRSWAKADEKPAKYINSPESPIYTKGEHLFGLYQARQAIRQTGEAVLVEGNFDVVSLHARGADRAVAPLGTAFTEHQARLLRRFAPAVTLFLDGDTAGKKATWAARGPCRSAGLTVRSVAVPPELDPDELARREGAEGLARLLREAPPLAQRLLDALLREGDFDGRVLPDPAARLRAAEQIVAEAGDDAERAVLRSYAERFALALQLGSSRDVEPLLARPAATPRAPARERPAAPFVEQMSQAALWTLLDFPELLQRDEVTSRLELLAGPAVLGVVALRAGGDAATIVARMPAEIRDAAAHRLAAPVFESVDESARSFRAFTRQIEAARLRARAEEPE